MTTYLARLIADKQLVGIFTVDDDSEIFWLVDECCDPGAVEIRELPTGGAYWSSPDAPTIPAIVTEDGEGGWQGLPVGSTISEGWREAFEVDDVQQDNEEEPVWKPVPRE